MVYELHNVMPQKIWLLEGSEMSSLLTHKQQLLSALEYHTASSSKSKWLGHEIVERSGSTLALSWFLKKEIFPVASAQLLGGAAIS